MTPTTSSLPAATGTGVRKGAASPGQGATLTGAPQLPQNFVISEIGPPHFPQNFPAGAGAAAAGARAATTGDPQIPQNFSFPVTGLPQDEHTYSAVAGTGGGGAWDTGGTVRGASGTLTRHLLQNLSPGLIGFPHARQTRGPDCWAGGGEYAGGGGGGGGVYTAGAAGAADPGDFARKPHDPQNFISGVMGAPQDGHWSTGGCGATGAGTNTGGGTGDGAGTGTAAGAVAGNGAAGAAGAGTPPDFAPHTPQNFSSGASVLPQDRQVSGAGGAATGGALADGDSSSSEAPQFRQNFCVEPTLFPHSGQKDMMITYRKIVPAR
jgi:hypothetical protein